MSDDRPGRPDPLDVAPDAIPEDLRDRDAWVCWRYDWDDDRDEWTKVPIDANTGGYARSTDPDTWTTLDEALAYHNRAGRNTDGVGFVVHDEDLVVGLDLDDCRDAETGDLEAWAEDVLDDVPTYAEVSPSGTGLRLFGLGFVPDGGNRSDDDARAGHLEMYDSGRYLTVTGQRVDSSPEDIRQVNDEIADLHAEFVDDATTGKTDGQKPDPRDANPGFDADKSGSTDAVTDLSDDDVLNVARNAENGQKFTRLYDRGDTAGYQSHSEARMALANLLAFYTGGDERQMLRLFEDSALYRGEDDTRTFTEYEAPKAVRNCSEFYDPGADRTTAADRPNTPGAGATDGGATATDHTGDSSPEPTVAFDPTTVEVWAGLGEDDDIAALTDREKAATVWEMIRASDEYHVRVRRDNAELWAYHGGVWEPNGERTLRHAARQALGSANYGQNVLAELKTQARGDVDAEVPGDEFGVNTGTVAVENGLLHLEAAAGDAGEDAIRELRPDDHALTRLPVEYDPGAEYDEWAAYVEEWAEDGYADALQEYVGYCLHVGAMPIHRALLLVGSGANGKGTFLTVVRALLGEENTSSIELQTLANERDAVAEFYGAIANIDDDLSERGLGAGIGMFKKLAGGDRVRARRLYEAGFDFQATGKHLYAANQVPDVTVSDEDLAFWRRWLLVEFPNKYPPEERDTGLRDRLTEPDRLAGVLNWAIDGWARLLDRGHFSGEETDPHEKRRRWQRWGDAPDEFISEHVTIAEDAENVTSREVHRRFRKWCRQEDKDDTTKPQTLTKKLKAVGADYGSVWIDGKQERGFNNVRLAEDVPQLTGADRGDHPGDAVDDTEQERLN